STGDAWWTTARQPSSVRRNTLVATTCPPAKPSLGSAVSPAADPAAVRMFSAHETTAPSPTTRVRTSVRKNWMYSVPAITNAQDPGPSVHRLPAGVHADADVTAVLADPQGCHRVQVAVLDRRVQRAVGLLDLLHVDGVGAEVGRHRAHRPPLCQAAPTRTASR